MNNLENKGHNKTKSSSSKRIDPSFISTTYLNNLFKLLENEMDISNLALNQLILASYDENYIDKWVYILNYFIKSAYP